MKRFAAAILVLLVSSGLMFAQEVKMTPPKPAHYEPTPEQMKDLKYLQAQVIIEFQNQQILENQIEKLQGQLEQTKGATQTAVSALLSKSEEIKNQAKWPSSLSFDMRTLKYEEAKPAVPAATPAPPVGPHTEVGIKK